MSNHSTHLTGVIDETLKEVDVVLNGDYYCYGELC